VNTVVFAREFRTDLQARTRRLLAEDREDWADRLMDEVAAAAALLANSPHIGPVESHQQGREVRRLLLRTLPFVVWYSVRDKKVLVLRLFHVRQRRVRH
jgi:plasmid stabilization system protein ParE